jgi:hypothetical protein
MVSNNGILKWIQDNKVRTNKGLPIEFRDHGFLLDYIKDEHNRIVVRKCTHPDTKILRADLRWIAIKDIQPGDSIVGFEEQSPKGKGNRRHFEESIVYDKWTVKKQAFKLTLEDGRSIIASDEHPFLGMITRGKIRNQYAWYKLSEYKPGDSLRVIFDVWESGHDYESGWMAGLMDGEGSLKVSRKSGGSDFVISQHPNGIADRAEAYLKYYGFKYHSRDDDHKDRYIHRNDKIRRLVLSRTSEIIRLIGQTQPTRWIDSKFWKGLALGMLGDKTKMKIVSIKPVGEIDLIDIETSSRTFIAEGIATHNCTQVGASFSTNVKMLHLGTQAPLTTIYTLPTSSEARNFVLTKFDPMVERSPGLLQMVQKVILRDRVIYNSVVKRIGESYYFFRGSWTTWGAQSIDADVLVVDELDFQKPDIRNMWEERTEGSASQDIIYWIGYPSVPNYGIEELYESSDQRMWFIECGHCFKRQVLEFPDNIDIVAEKYICKFCKQELTDDMRRKGLWKITKPGRKIHGYWVNKLMAPWISAPKIMERFRKDTPKKFFNYTLGLPYVSKETELSDSIIQGAMIEEEEYALVRSSGDIRVVCGVDQGDIFHLLVAVVTPSRIVVTSAEQLKDEDELIKKLKSYNPDMVIMDMFPNRHTAKKVCTEFGPQKFFMAKERNWTDVSKARNYWTLNRATSEVGIERTESIDAMIEYIIKGVIKFRRSIPRLVSQDKQDPGVMQQLKNLVPDTQERHGRMRRVFKAIGPEHYGHALNFVVTAAHIVYPGWMSRELLVPSNYLDELKHGKLPKPWYIKEYEEMTRGLDPSDTIIIKPGGEITEPQEDDTFYPRVC